VACCKDASRVDAEHALDDCDKFLYINQISLLSIGSSGSSNTVVRVRLQTCRNANALHVDGNSERICVWIVEPGLLLDSLGLSIVAMEREYDRRRFVDVVVSRYVYEETSRHPVGRRHVESYTRSVCSQVCRYRYSTSSACSCNWDGIVWVWRNEAYQSCLAGSRGCETAKSGLEVARTTYIDGSFTIRRGVTLQRAVVDANSS